MFAAACADDFQSTGYSGGAASYLSIPLEGAASALAGAVTAWKQDLCGLQFNPAVLDGVKPKSIELNGSYALMTLDRRHTGVSVAGSAGPYLAAGLSFTNFAINNIEGRDLAGNLTQNFDYQENCVAAAVAGRLEYGISLGCAVKGLFESLDSGSAKGVGIDAGVTWSPLPELTIALSGLNMGGTLWWNTGMRDQVLPQARFGINYAALGKTLIAEFDASKCTSSPADISVGVEYTLLSIVQVRGGIATSVNNNQQWVFRQPDYSLGAGLRYSFFGFDYAHSSPRRIWASSTASRWS